MKIRHSRLSPEAGTVLADFARDDSGLAAIIGPVGSGKTTAAIARLVRHALEQTPDAVTGIREVRFTCLRSTYRELWATTIETWRAIFPQTRESWTGGLNDPVEHVIDLEHPDGSTVTRMTMVFRALTDDFESMLRGMEVTGFWLNEADKLPERVLQLCATRVGRYPKTVSSNGIRASGPVWKGVIMDLNAADDLSWIHPVIHGATCRMFEQPPAVWREGEEGSDGDGEVVIGKEGSRWVLNPAAENRENLPEAYYRDQVANLDDREITRMLRNQPAPPAESRAVFARSWRPDFHVPKVTLHARPEIPLLIGADAGRTPRAVIGQVLDNGQGVILAECGEDGCSAKDFADIVKRLVDRRWPRFRVIPVADPSAGNPTEASDATWLDIMRVGTGWNWTPAPGKNVLEDRLEAVDAFLRFSPAPGTPGLIVAEECRMLRQAMQTGYRFQKIKGSDDRWSEKPNKGDAASHIADALQYWCLAAGGSQMARDRRRRALGGTSKLPRTTITARDVRSPRFLTGAA